MISELSKEEKQKIIEYERLEMQDWQNFKFNKNMYQTRVDALLREGKTQQEAERIVDSELYTSVRALLSFQHRRRFAKNDNKDNNFAKYYSMQICLDECEILYHMLIIKGYDEKAAYHKAYEE